jgi:hypothetical protein
MSREAGTSESAQESRNAYLVSAVSKSAATLDPAFEPIGLSSDDAKRRLEDDGPNAIAQTAVAPWRDALGKFWAPVPWMLELAILLQLAGRKIARDRFAPATGSLQATWPLSLIQIDHTLVDVIVVDSVTRTTPAPVMSQAVRGTRSTFHSQSMATATYTPP